MKKNTWLWIIGGALVVLYFLKQQQTQTSAVQATATAAQNLGNDISAAVGAGSTLATGIGAVI
jgi:hypothetical protein